MEFKSQIGQDSFVLNQLKNKKNGFFIDIGSGHPININNTIILEKDYDWSGISFDIGPPHTYGLGDVSVEEFIKIWNDNRNTKLITGDSREHDFRKIFEDNNVPKIIDYLSIDLDPPTVTFEVLKMIPFDEYQFRVITFNMIFIEKLVLVICQENYLKVMVMS
jgi:hypothetical protein